MPTLRISKFCCIMVLHLVSPQRLPGSKTMMPFGAFVFVATTTDKLFHASPALVRAINVL